MAALNFRTFAAGIDAHTGCIHQIGLLRIPGVPLRRRDPLTGRVWAVFACPQNSARRQGSVGARRQGVSVRGFSAFERCFLPSPRSRASRGCRRTGRRKHGRTSARVTATMLLDLASEDPVLARVNRILELADLPGLAPHQLADPAMRVTERADTEQPHRSRGKRGAVGAQELGRARHPVLIVDAAAENHRVVSREVIDVIHWPSVDLSSGFREPDGDSPGDTSSGSVPGRVGDQNARALAHVREPTPVDEGPRKFSSRLSAAPADEPGRTRQITPTAIAVQPRVLRCALARDAGVVMVPRMLGSDFAGSVNRRCG